MPVLRAGGSQSGLARPCSGSQCCRQSVRLRTSEDEDAANAPPAFAGFSAVAAAAHGVSSRAPGRDKPAVPPSVCSRRSSCGERASASALAGCSSPWPACAATVGAHACGACSLRSSASRRYCARAAA
eukprot:6527388-Prymnesium_polylepis.1